MTGLLEPWLLNRKRQGPPSVETRLSCPVHGWSRASRTWVASSQAPLSINPNIPGGPEAGGCLATSLLPLTPMYVLLRGVLAQAGQGQDGHTRPREGLERGQKASFSQRGYLIPWRGPGVRGPLCCGLFAGPSRCCHGNGMGAVGAAIPQR